MPLPQIPPPPWLIVSSITAILERLEQSRLQSILLVIHDPQGVVCKSEALRHFLGNLLEHTQRCRILLCSPDPIYGLFGSFTLGNVLLSPLSGKDAAKLFLHCINRPLAPPDFPGGVEPISEKVSQELLKQLISEHPLLQILRGNPKRICSVATEQVIPNGPSLVQIADELSNGIRV